jgi:hypothetical protein
MDSEPVSLSLCRTDVGLDLGVGVDVDVDVSAGTRAGAVEEDLQRAARAREYLNRARLKTALIP